MASTKKHRPEPPHHRERWTPAQDRQLRRDARQDMDTDDIAKDLGRTKNAIYDRASELGISLDPSDKPDR